MSAVTVTPFQLHHLDDLADILLRVRAEYPTYPPQQDAQPNRASLTDWLLNVPQAKRWVALVDGQVAGHVLVAPAPDYIVNHLSRVYYQTPAHGLAEIAKLFADPQHHAQGVGGALLAHAQSAAWASGRQPSLAVVATSTAAAHLYTRAGMLDTGSFTGFHGVNRVFVCERRPVLPPVL